MVIRSSFTKKEPELKRPGNGTSCDLEGRSGWHDPYIPEWQTKANLSRCRSQNWTQFADLGTGCNRAGRGRVLSSWLDGDRGHTLNIPSWVFRSHLGFEDGENSTSHVQAQSGDWCLTRRALCVGYPVSFSLIFEIGSVQLVCLYRKKRLQKEKANIPFFISWEKCYKMHDINCQPRYP